MRFWTRELAGWLLVLMGLFVFYVCFGLLADVKAPSRILEAGPLVFIGFIIFRGGIHLLKVALAARVCLQAQAEMRDQEPGQRGRPAGRDPRIGRFR
jgi:hypothetical protein